jgi:hypothetical protein
VIKLLEGRRIKEEDAGEAIDLSMPSEGKEEASIWRELELVDLVISFPEDGLRLFLIQLLDDDDIC